MAAPTPRTWTSSHIDADDMNDEIRDVVDYLMHRPRCLVRRTTDQNITTSTGTNVNFTTELYKDGVTHSNVTNSSRLTIVDAGIYLVFAAIEFASSAGNTRRDVTITKNGDPAFPAGSQNVNAMGSVPNQLSVQDGYLMAAGDYFTVRVYQASGSTVAVTSASTFGCVFLRKSP